MGIEAGSSTYYQAKRGTVQDGLVLHLDAGVKESYGGAGNIIRDISGNGYNGTLYNGPTFSRTQKKPSLSFDGSNEFIAVPSPSNAFSWTPSGVGLHEFTIDLWVKTEDTVGYYFSKPWGGGQYNITMGHNFFGLYCLQSKNISISSLATGDWENVIGVANSTQMASYRNGVVYTDFVNHNITSNEPPVGTAQNQPLCIMFLVNYGTGTYNLPQYAVNGNVGCVRIYSRVLSDDEISQNYNATRHRFGV